MIAHAGACFLPVPLSDALTLTMPLASMSNATSQVSHNEIMHTNKKKAEQRAAQSSMQRAPLAGLLAAGLWETRCLRLAFPDYIGLELVCLEIPNLNLPTSASALAAAVPILASICGTPRGAGGMPTRSNLNHALGVGGLLGSKGSRAQRPCGAWYSGAREL